MKYKETTFSNGLVLRYAKNTSSRISLVDIRFNCGARCDTIAGLAHFTEHLFFSGTKYLNKQEVSKLYNKFLNVNAYTNAKTITFTGSVFTSELGEYMSVVKKLIDESTFSRLAIKKELPVILQEISAREDDNSTKFLLWDLYNFTEENVYKNGILGSKESVKKITSKEVKAFVKDYFVANNCEIFVVSPLSFSAVRRLVEENFSNGFKCNENLKPLSLDFGELKCDNFFLVKQKKINKVYLSVDFINSHSVYELEFNIKLDFILDMLNDFAEGVTKFMRIKKSLTYGCRFENKKFKNFSVVEFITECDGDNVNEILATLSEYIKSLLKTGFSDEQIKQAKRGVAYDREQEEPRAEKHLSHLYELMQFKTVISSKFEDSIIKKINKSECNKIFADIFSSSKVCLSIFGDYEKTNLISNENFAKLWK